MKSIMTTLSEALLINLFAIKFFAILLCLVLLVTGASAQTTMKINQSPVLTTNLKSLHVPAGLECVFVPTKGTRVFVVQNITVSHPSKEEAISNFIKNTDAYSLDASSDFIHSSLIFKTKQGSNLVVDGKVALIKSTYTIYVPEDMIIRKG